MNKYSFVQSQFYGAIRKVDSSGNQVWLASLAFELVEKSLSIDSSEQNVYIARNADPLLVFKLLASNGAILSQHEL